MSLCLSVSVSVSIPLRFVHGQFKALSLPGEPAAESHCFYVSADMVRPAGPDDEFAADDAGESPVPRSFQHQHHQHQQQTAMATAAAAEDMQRPTVAGMPTATMSPATFGSDGIGHRVSTVSWASVSKSVGFHVVDGVCRIARYAA